MRVEDTAPGARLNLTVSASHGRMAIQHDWHARTASLVGTAREINDALDIFGISYQGEPDWSTDLCGGLVDLELRVAEMLTGARTRVEHLSVAVRARPDELQVRVTESAVLLDSVAALTRSHLTVEDTDHCCTAFGLTNDASLAMLLLIRDAEVSITPSPYVSRGACAWSSSEEVAGQYDANAGGWPLQVGLMYADSYASVRGSWQQAESLAGPPGRAEAIAHELPQPIFASRLRLEVLRFRGFPALRFEVYGCVEAPISDLWEPGPAGKVCTPMTDGVVHMAGKDSVEACKATCLGSCRAITYRPTDAEQDKRCRHFLRCDAFANDHSTSSAHLRRLPTRNLCPHPYPLVWAKPSHGALATVSASSTQDSAYFSATNASIDSRSAWLASLVDPQPYIEVRFSRLPQR